MCYKEQLYLPAQPHRAPTVGIRSMLLFADKYEVIQTLVHHSQTRLL